MTKQEHTENRFLAKARGTLNRFEQTSPSQKQIVTALVLIAAILAAYLVLFFTDGLIYHRIMPDQEFRIRDFSHQVTSFLIIVLCLGAVFLTGRIKGKRAQSFLYFLLLFCLYTLRAPGDAFASYLWAEDGQVLIQEAIDYGIPSLFHERMGSIWFLPRLVGLICYWIVRPFGSLAALPVLQGIVTRILAVSGVFYFASEKFSWLVKEKRDRVLICAAVILLLPGNGADFLTCDTSLHFLLNIPVFLIGLDHFGRKQPTRLSLPETGFLFLMTISTPAAILVFAVGALTCFRWGFHVVRNGLNRTQLVAEVLKVLLLTAGLVIQLTAVFGSGRGNLQLDLLKRVLFTAKGFVFIPYWHASWHGALFGLVFLALLIWVARPQLRATLFSLVYSYLFLMYCMMTAATAEASLPILRTPRYVLISYCAAALVIGLSVLQLLKTRGPRRILGWLVTAVLLLISWQTYPVDIIGKQYARQYDEYASLYKPDGEYRLRIPTGPYQPWELAIPASLKQPSAIQSVEGEITRLAPYDAEMTVTGSVSIPESQSLRRLLARPHDGQNTGRDLIAATFFGKDGQTGRWNYSFLITHEAWDDFPCELEIIAETADGDYYSFQKEAVGDEPPVRGR